MVLDAASKSNSSSSLGLIFPLLLVAMVGFLFYSSRKRKTNAQQMQTTLKVGLEKSDWNGFEARRAEAKQRGKLRGIGISTYLEACGIAPSKVVGSLGARAGLYEVANVRVHPTGSVSVFTGTHSHGQGHETTLAQVIADELGGGFDDVRVVFGDTDATPYSMMGTAGSKAAMMATGAWRLTPVRLYTLLLDLICNCESFQIFTMNLTVLYTWLC